MSIRDLKYAPPSPERLLHALRERWEKSRNPDLPNGASSAMWAIQLRQCSVVICVAVSQSETPQAHRV